MARTLSVGERPVHHRSKPFYKHMYGQVLIAIAIGTTLGLVAPSLAVQMRPLGDGFSKLIRMLRGFR